MCWDNTELQVKEISGSNKLGFDYPIFCAAVVSETSFFIISEGLVFDMNIKYRSNTLKRKFIIIHCHLL